MDLPSVLCVLLGCLFIAGRGPLIFAPRATLSLFDRLISSDTRLRGIGVGLAPVAAALIMIRVGDGVVGQVLQVLGWLWAAGTLLLLIVPGVYRGIAHAVLGWFDSPAGELRARILGVVAVALGIGLVYYGIYVV